MYAVSSDFLRALRDAHTMYVRVDAWRSGALVASDIPFTDGTVTVAAGTGVRRSLDLTVPDKTLFDTLSPLGTELRPYRGIRYPNGSVESVPLGIFGIDSQNLGLAPGGAVEIRSAPDRWARVQRARFEAPNASQSGTLISAEVLRLVNGAISGLATANSSTSTATVATLVWERDREAAMAEMLTSIGAEGYFDWTGRFVIRDAPKLSAPPVWTVDASASGVLLDGSRSRDRTRTYNVVVVTASSVDGATPFAAQTIADNDATSPTWVGGSMGRVPYFYSSPLVTTTGQAQVAGAALLNQVKGLAAQLQLTSVCNPALDRGDVIWVLTTVDGIVERHLIDALTIPLTTAGTQSITTRSSRPDGDVPASE